MVRGTAMREIETRTRTCAKETARVFTETETTATGTEIEIGRVIRLHIPTESRIHTTTIGGLMKQAIATTTASALHRGMILKTNHTTNPNLNLNTNTSSEPANTRSLEERLSGPPLPPTPTKSTNTSANVPEAPRNQNPNAVAEQTPSARPDDRDRD